MTNSNFNEYSSGFDKGFLAFTSYVAAVSLPFAVFTDNPMILVEGAGIFSGAIAYFLAGTNERLSKMKEHKLQLSSLERTLDTEVSVYFSKLFRR